MAAFGTTDFHHPHRVLYLDPDPTARRRTADGLESAADISVEPVATPSELRTALADAPECACVVTEYRFEETDALSLCERLRDDGDADVPFVLYTADGDETLASDAITAGLAGYVPREAEDSIERLLAQIGTVVDAAGGAGETDATDRSPRTRERPPPRAERDHFAAVFELSPDPIVVRRRAEPTEIVDVNDAFEATFGYDRSDIAESSLEDFLVPDDAEPLCLAEADGHGEAITAEVERLTADGRSEFRLLRFETEFEGEVYEYALYTDISKQKRRERELERYRTLVETVGDSMYVLDAEGTIEMVNDAMADRIGESRENLVGSDPADYMSDEDIERGKKTLLDIVDDDSRNWGTFEMSFEPVDGQPSLAEDNVAPLVDEDGNLAGSVGVIRDISDRKKRERRIRRLHDGTRLLMASSKTEDVARVASRVARDALELRMNAVHLYDETEDELVPVAVTDRTEELLGEVPAVERNGGLAWDAFEAGEAIAHGDVRLDPNVRNPETPIRSEAHIPIGDAGVFIVGSTEPNDFDEEALALAKILVANVEVALQRANREDELAARTAELERQNDRLEAFASTVSHDLRNPLTLAMGHTENVAPHLDDEGERYCEEIRWALDRMDGLIENLLTLARTGQRLTTTEPVDLDTIVDQARRTVDPDLRVVRDEPLPTVEADGDRLLVLFENVFRNALEHAGDDVAVTIEGTDDGFAIADDGPGIPVDERENVLESGYSTASDGTGFGLAIVSEVVQAHGWSIAVDESDAGGLRLAFSIAE
ncbi:hybrid sensor histidine kinase/response regulator [Natrinema caseinilyticum]|uniref:hybrid sensor histidine kinase/response regulator n=1 Tax=Natrinema caseinilyticum TaxID=2961570 RepID=UPI0020C4AE28|nr:PAS domain S-box protein [Natrinema caseinilyticum]